MLNPTVIKLYNTCNYKVQMRYIKVKLQNKIASITQNQLY